MKKIINQKFAEVYYRETLDNGLKVVINHKPNFKNTTCVFATPYGALNHVQIINGEKFVSNYGVAHFLEHKLFEAESNDVMTDFTAMGCSVNAFTSYTETAYYFSTTNDNIDKPLNLLLDFVQKLDITNESVEKEKGIIIQELKMYEQMPNARLINEVDKALFANIPLNNDIGGSEQSVRAITKEELERCYQYNYSPDNMSLYITTSIDPKHLLEVIKANQASKKFLNQYHISKYDYHEPQNVVNSKVTVTMPVSTNKVAYAFKLATNFASDLLMVKKEWALRIILELHFSTLNPAYEQWLSEDLITNFFGYDLEFNQDYAYIIFYNENIEPEVFKSFIDQQLCLIQQTPINQDKILQLQKRFYGRSFEIFNNIEEMTISLMKQDFANVSYYEMISQILKIDATYCQQILDTTDFSHTTLVNISE